MVLIDSLYINNGGGKLLLDYLVEELEKKGGDYFYLFDNRCKSDYFKIPSSRKVYLTASLISRHNFYLKNKKKFTKIFCFGNIPPTIKLDIPVYTYLHQRIYLEIPRNLSLKLKILFSLKSLVFKFLIKNTDFFFVQTQSMKNDFLKKNVNFSFDNIKIIPFYKSLDYPPRDRIKGRMIYVSGGNVHKNHEKLLYAFKLAYDKVNCGELVVTIGEDFFHVKNLIDKLVADGYPIINLGYLSKNQLGQEYSKSEFSIFPSLSESFGLGIIEALEGGCKIIGADLEYMYTICEPSLTFDPFDTTSIASAIIESLTKDTRGAKAKVINDLNILLEILN